jgi:hypothetical protein
MDTTMPLAASQVTFFTDVAPPGGYNSPLEPKSAGSDMDRGAVLAKTVKGTEEIKSRRHGLPPKVRALLVIVDGRTTAGELVAKLGGSPEIENGLQSLIDQGYVETVGEPAPEPKKSAAPPCDDPIGGIDLGGG